MTENITRQPKGVPVGGQFAAAAHAEAPVTLVPEPATYSAPLTGTVELHTQWFDKLPAWPEGLPEPEVNFGFDDGKAETYVTVDGKMMTFWDSDSDGVINDTSYGSNPWEDFDMEDQEKAEEWGKAVHERIDSATYGVMIEGSHSPGVKEIILAHAIGDEPPASEGLDLTDEDVRNAYVIDAHAKVSAARRELEQVYMIGAAQELKEDFPDIDTFELHVGGKHLEIAAAWDVDGNPVSNEILGAASTEVFRYRDEDDFHTFLDGQVIDVNDAIAFRPAG